ncbi:hypothetical protein PRIPAC_76395 [Pristionchus pacificus]|uniref:Uncharacterized protein n=1 Tax=Pristionchus pacificus TaxID=54126 RepID=A0A2A6C164_PRIPA|nr:hypothetical protein PRIPAC_76395 [Pristionchus pacificus]|eukprot:PDM71914.1 hypothetical protein PRIPAC_38321 [Pristionchus pacificus]
MGQRNNSVMLAANIEKMILESSDPFPQLRINQAYVPAASSTNIAYKPCSDCLRARVRLTICGPQFDRLLDVTSPHGRTMRGLERYRSPRRFETIPQVGIKHFPQDAIKLDSKLIPDTRDKTGGDKRKKKKKTRGESRNASELTRTKECDCYFFLWLILLLLSANMKS